MVQWVKDLALSLQQLELLLWCRFNPWPMPQVWPKKKKKKKKREEDAISISHGPVGES